MAILSELFWMVGRLEILGELVSMGRKKIQKLLAQMVILMMAKKDRGDKAIEEMKRFLEKHPANLYKSALEDLLCGLNRGEGSDYEETILSLAAKNHIHHPQ